MCHHCFCPQAQLLLIFGFLPTCCKFDIIVFPYSDGTALLHFLEFLAFLSSTQFLCYVVQNLHLKGLAQLHSVFISTLAGTFPCFPFPAINSTFPMSFFCLFLQHTLVCRCLHVICLAHFLPFYKQLYWKPAFRSWVRCLNGYTASGRLEGDG